MDSKNNYHKSENLLLHKYLLVSKKKFPVSYDDCFKTTQLLNAFYISDEKNKKIDVLKAMDSKRLGRKNDKISKLYR